ncbi:2-polyprenyl-3-methyl-5-hydroxy-6-metoxy-1,4-benzoquinol methylase [Fodinibius salinus]|uniref:2-polyprenyl-3-methyl-5-hydroxy-6-metoxy-1, 4-benzoquinol methylase n=1 Tax=Fodinibius salinus TaxID=860790 RepID=A0A5D3YPL2_9BACT|nr:methyltransferase domain-containing protein [Fodinibius salinus]TYP94119.1 2-polyprenyl-3-methyl-5-hydroxy-6-metoxy-1,4-benzoquinol methylase [Fodinibius salinus]
MTFFLSDRDRESHEQMDDPNCDFQALQNTYRQFSTINNLVSRWHSIYKKHIRPTLHPQKPTTLLDIGFGGGDIPIKLATWASNDGLALQITAIDPDPRAFQFVQKLEYPKNISFLQCSSSDITDQTFDFVISNHLLHHLSSAELSNLLTEAELMSSKQVLFNDLRRNDWSYFLFGLFASPIFHNSFITEDGLTSIKRSYTAPELEETVPDGWKITSRFPFRLLLSFTHD